MAKKSKLSTPQWILEGYDSKEDYDKAQEKKSGNKKKNEKTFKIRKCPACGSFDVVVVTGEEAVGLWRCTKCNWKGKDADWEEMNEEEFMKYLDEKEENESEAEEVLV